MFIIFIRGYRSMKRIITVLLTAVLILTAGTGTVFAEDTGKDKPIIIISNIDLLSGDTQLKTYGFPYANIEIVNERWIIPKEFVIGADDINISNGKYSYQLILRSNGTMAFNNDLEIYYQGIDGLYRLNYIIDETDNHLMEVDGLFDNIIVASPLIDKLPEKISTIILARVRDDSYDYNLDLKTQDGFTFRNKLQFIFDTQPYSYATDYAYDLSSDTQKITVYLTKGNKSLVLGPIEIGPIFEEGQKIVKDISEKVSGISVGSYADYINKIVSRSDTIVSKFAENISSSALPSASDVYNDIKDKVAERKEKLTDMIPDVSDLRSDVRELIVRFWDRSH